MMCAVWCASWWEAMSVMDAAFCCGYTTEISEAGEGWLVEFE